VAAISPPWAISRFATAIRRSGRSNTATSVSVPMPQRGAALPIAARNRSSAGSSRRRAASRVAAVAGSIGRGT
jgi:hypothetical protein